MTGTEAHSGERFLGLCAKAKRHLSWRPGEHVFLFGGGFDDCGVWTGRTGKRTEDRDSYEQ